MARFGLFHTLNWLTRPFSTSMQLLSLPAMNVLIEPDPAAITYYTTKYAFWACVGQRVSYRMGDRTGGLPTIRRSMHLVKNSYEVIHHGLTFEYNPGATMMFISRCRIEISIRSSPNISIELFTPPTRITRQVLNPGIKLHGSYEDAELAFKHFLKIRDDMLRLGY